ncbi:lithostathine-like isoform X2 [Hemicordylus capensis]|uniref:lithostathine-like isoform X2 n=1 Tax=Hemicordylus capensis TaxID=884348 RepID=UPI0023033FAE|nr:lithostathine-like isoform X2 [Hemicordylus capensis]
MGPVNCFRLYCLSLLAARLFLRPASSSELGKHYLVIGSKTCPRGWRYYQKSCYGLFTDHLTWSAAEVECFNVNSKAHLASILNWQEMKEIAKYINNTYNDVGHIWIGLNDPNENQRWRWSDLSMVRFKPWDFGEPSNTNKKEFCVHLTAQSGYMKWNDADCSLEMAYLCKYSA